VFYSYDYERMVYMGIPKDIVNILEDKGFDLNEKKTEYIYSFERSKQEELIVFLEELNSNLVGL